MMFSARNVKRNRLPAKPGDKAWLIFVFVVVAWIAIGIRFAPAADVGLTDAERASIETQLRARGYPCDQLSSLERKADDPATGALIFKATCGRRQVYRGVVADVFNVAGSIAVAPWNYRKHGR